MPDKTCVVPCFISLPSLLPFVSAGGRSVGPFSVASALCVGPCGGFPSSMRFASAGGRVFAVSVAIPLCVGQCSVGHKKKAGTISCRRYDAPTVCVSAFITFLGIVKISLCVLLACFFLCFAQLRLLLYVIRCAKIRTVYRNFIYLSVFSHVSNNTGHFRLFL